MKRTTLASILTKNVTTLSIDVTVSYAMEVMSLGKLSSLIIVDVDNRPIGIFTERDSLKVISGKIALDSHLGDVMTQSVYTVHLDDEIHDTYAVMSDKGFRHLVIVDDDGRLEGVATQGDFLRHIGFDNMTYSKNITTVMTKSVVMLNRDATITYAASVMAEHHSDYAVITEGMIPVGLITERDILQYASAKNEFSDDPIWRVYQSDFPVCTEKTSLSEAASLMEHHGVHQLIIADQEGNLVGLLTRYDLLQALHGSYFEFLIGQLDKKNAVIEKMGERKKELANEKESIEKNALKLQKLLEALPDGVVLIENSTMLAVEFNRRAYENLGYSANEFRKLKISDYNAVESEEETSRRIEAIRKNGMDVFETFHRTKKGDIVDVLVNVVAVDLEGIPHMIAVYHDITLRKRNERRLLNNQEAYAQQAVFLNTVINTIPDLVWVKDTDGVYLACNEMFERFFGANESIILGKTDFDFVSPELAQFFLDNDRASIAAGGSKTNEEFLKFADGSHEGLFDTIKTPMKNSDGNIMGVLGIARDITERKRYEEQLETLANYDPLTGLANRALLSSHLKNTIEKAKRNKIQISVLMFDLDRFKDVNDSFGHAAGDELLQQVAQRFDMRLRDGDIISRLGGDEFAIVLEHLGRPEDAGRIAKEMIEAQNAPYKLISGSVVHIGMSAGIVIFPDHGESASELLQHADAALYKAKGEGRGTYRYYTDELTDSARQRIEYETCLRRGIENNEFEVYYQPQVHIATGKIVGAEALVRWNNPNKGMILPSLFIPIAEDTGLISAIGEWVLNETCRQGKIWLDGGHRLTLAVNLSAHQVRHQNIPAMVEAALKKSGYPADKLELELTESALMQREEETVAMLHMLRAQGIRLAIDDFGTGYSSLSYLKRFPIDVLKIDKSFVDDLPFDADDMAIVTAIIAMGTALGFQILAEGTERIEQIEFLKERGCTMYQGYYKSPPLPAAEFIKLLEK